MLGARLPGGIYEGAFASRNPYGSLPTNSVVGPVDIAVGRFGWLDPLTDEAGNVAIDNAIIGLVQPRYGRWPLTYVSKGVRFVRAGKPITLCVTGDFWVKFPNGANIGASVYADPATGIAYAADGGGFVLTKWKAVTNVRVGGLGVISPYPQIGVF
jgi:hypothetical protein